MLLVCECFQHVINRKPFFTIVFMHVIIEMLMANLLFNLILHTCADAIFWPTNYLNHLVVDVLYVNNMLHPIATCSYSDAFSFWKLFLTIHFSFFRFIHKIAAQRGSRELNPRPSGLWPGALTIGPLSRRIGAKRKRATFLLQGRPTNSVLAAPGAAWPRNPRRPKHQSAGAWVPELQFRFALQRLF